MSRAGFEQDKAAKNVFADRSRLDIRLSDGRRLRYAIFGAELSNPATLPVLALHGTPGSRLKYQPAAEAARVRNIALIAVDRWGYGGTEAPAKPGYRAFAADMSELLDRLSVERAAIVGISGGGPFAAATAAALGARIGPVALPAPVGIITPPIGAEPVRLSPFHTFCFRGLARSKFSVRAVFRFYRKLLEISPRAAIAVAMARSGPNDRALLDKPQIVAGLAGMMREGLGPGLDGPALDLELFRKAWDVDPAEIKGPAKIWLGDQDGSVPAGAIEALAELGGCELERVGGQGHFWIATRFDEVLDWLAEASQPDVRPPSRP